LIGRDRSEPRRGRSVSSRFITLDFVGDDPRNPKSGRSRGTRTITAVRATVTQNDEVARTRYLTATGAVHVRSRNAKSKMTVWCKM
jgi:hypothetical protein